MASDTAGEWQVAKSRKGRLRHTPGCRPHELPQQVQRSGPADPDLVKRLATCVRQQAQSLKCSSYWASVLGAVQEGLQATPSNSLAAGSETSAPAVRLLCLGIGSPESSQSAVRAWQLSLAWLLAEVFGIQERHWADPQMQAVDCALGTEFGFALAEAEDSASRPCGRPLLLFMPHCDRALYEMVLAENEAWPWPDALADIVLVGNSFKAYQERDDFRMVASGPGAPSRDSVLQRLYPAVSESPLPEFASYPEAFNDISVMTFPLSLLQAMPVGPGSSHGKWRREQQ
ncbi:SRR1 [Symbiodinium microadriaticum]|nr:SRR1 [Symbiodinium microadriaticum]